MRAAVLDASGLEGVRVREVPDPEPGPGEVLVRVESVGVNQLDLNAVMGTGPGTAARLPRVPGLDPAGVVERVGDGSDASLAGAAVVVKPNIPCGRCAACRTRRESECPAQEVVGVHRDGGAAEYVVVPERVVFRRDGLDAETATAAVHSVPVVLNAFRAAEVVAGDRVLITGAGGVLGRVAVDVGLSLGAHMTAASRRPLPELPDGVERVVTGPGADLDGALPPGRAFDAVVDVSGSASLLGRAVARLDWSGRAVFCSAAVDGDLHLDARAFYARRLRLAGVASADLDHVRRGLALVRDGAVHVPVAARYPLDGVVDAYRAFLAPRRGKVVIRVR